MFDLLEIEMPFITGPLCSHFTDGAITMLIDDKYCLDIDKIGVYREMSISPDGELLRIKHPFESLPSSFTGMAIKIYDVTKSGVPTCNIKCSPAKVSQGHNTCGSTDADFCVHLMLHILRQNYPKLFSYLDLSKSRVIKFDVTYSVNVPDKHRYAFMSFMKNVGGGHTRTTSTNFQTTCYWNPKSEYAHLKLYLKREEVQNFLKTQKYKLPEHVYNKIVDSHTKEVLEFCKNHARFEATIMTKGMKQWGIPQQLDEFIEHFDNENNLRNAWKQAFKQIFKSLQGKTMKFSNDLELKHKIRMHHQKITPKGNVSYALADKIFQFYKNIKDEGYLPFKESMKGNTTFYRHEILLMQVGLTKAFLQNITADTNIQHMPVFQLINVTETAQYFDSWKQPTINYLKAV